MPESDAYDLRPVSYHRGREGGNPKPLLHLHTQVVAYGTARVRREASRASHGLSADAIAARSATTHECDDHPVPDIDTRNPRTQRLDHSCCFVAEHSRSGGLPLAVDIGKIAPADSRRGDPNPDFPKSRIGEV